MNKNWVIRVLIIGTLVYLFRHTCWHFVAHFLRHAGI